MHNDMTGQKFNMLTIIEDSAMLDKIDERLSVF